LVIFRAVAADVDARYSALANRRAAGILRREGDDSAETIVGLLDRLSIWVGGGQGRSFDAAERKAGASAILGRMAAAGLIVTRDSSLRICPSCGAPQAGGVATAMAPAASTQSGLSENVAGLLCYVLGWITGLIFYFIDKRPFVRFHAAQSIVVFGGLTVIRFVLAMLFVPTGLAGFSMGFGLLALVSLLGFALWILLMVKAYQGEKFRIPLAADLVDQFFGKS
jgi:uncharacterized membrane protein